MFAYYEVQALTRQGGPTADNSAEFIEDCRRLLVSELQAHLDPRRRDEIIERYDDQRQDHRSDALKRSKNLKASLAARRPEIKIDGQRATAAAAATNPSRPGDRSMSEAPASAYDMTHEDTPEERRTIAVMVDNEPGVLARVVGLFSARGFNIESLTVAEVDETRNRSRITIVTNGTPELLEQIEAQLLRLVPVDKVVDITKSKRGG